MPSVGSLVSLIDILIYVRTHSRASRQKLEELLQQWSEWHNKHVSPSNVRPIVFLFVNDRPVTQVYARKKKWAEEEWAKWK